MEGREHAVVVGAGIAGLTRRAGTRRTYLAREEWVAELGAAGLPPVLELPRPDHPLAAFSQHLLIAAPDLRGRAR